MKVITTDVPVPDKAPAAMIRINGNVTYKYIEDEDHAYCKKGIVSGHTTLLPSYEHR